jgi:hypothetical protein
MAFFSGLSVYCLPQVVPVDGSPMTTLPPPGRMSMMSLLAFPHVVLEEGFPRPIVEPGEVEMRSGWEMGLVFVYMCRCVREKVKVEVEVKDCQGEV